MENYRTFICDFETTVYSGQTSTDVWAAACVEMNTEDVQIFHSIGEQFDYFESLKSNVIAYYHNLKFDGSFWLYYLLIVKGFRQAVEHLSAEPYDVKWLQNKRMSNNTVKYSISDRGLWYTITIKIKGGFIIELRDSLKLLPFSVAEIGKSFKTKHQKLTMEYEGFRYPGCNITPEEQEYIANDVLVVKEAMEIMFNQGHDRLTIGGCCLNEYKNIMKSSTKFELDYDEMFPDLYQIKIDPEDYGCRSAGEYVRKSYRGGWCYLVKGKEHKIYKNGTTADVNSLYPSMMSSESGNRYPVGTPRFWKGDFIPDAALQEDKYYFVRVKTRFYIKPGKLPFIQIKNSLLYRGTESLESSDVYDYKTEKYYSYYTDHTGIKHDTRVELTLSMTDYTLIKEHYDLVDFEILDGCYFGAMTGIFDEYIDKYKKIKMQSKGAIRQIAKLFLNNLYGKMATSTDSSFKLAILKEDGSLGFIPIVRNDKCPGYIPCGCAITSYARNFTIRAAQENYYGVDSPGFIYADTDSIHCDLPAEELRGIKVDPVEFNHWSLESYWDVAVFARQKTYIEHITHADQELLDTPKNIIKCAGMPPRCKELLDLSFQDRMCPVYNTKEYTTNELNFLFDKNKKPILRTYEDFNVGLKIPSKLMPKRIPGGTLLVDTYYEMK